MENIVDYLQIEDSIKFVNKKYKGNIFTENITRKFFLNSDCNIVK